MRLHILGCGDAFGSGGRQQSAYLIETNDGLFLLDCGPTALLAMKRAGFAPQRLDAIAISHLHGDHFGGLPFFFIDGLYRMTRHKPLIIAGPPGTEDRVLQLTEIMYGARGPGQMSSYVFQVLKPDESQRIGPLEVFPFRVPHQTHDISLALKVTHQGKQMLFSGDSAWTEQFIEYALGVDLFLCECSFYREQPGQHINYQTLRANLPRLDCRRIVLTHLGEEMLAHRDEFPVMIAEDGMVIEI